MTLEDIGEYDSALLCMTNLTACCSHRYPRYWPYVGNWFFPNRSRVPNSYSWSDYYRTRGEMVVHLNRRRGGEDGIYHCEIPDSMGVFQNIYIGVYSTSSGEWHYLYALVLYNYSQTV